MPIKPPNYYQTPNFLVDDLWLPKLSELEVKILWVIFRKTFGWHKEKDEISLSQLKKYAGGEKTNILNAVKRLQEKGLIHKEVTGKFGTEKTIYHLTLSEDSNNSDQCYHSTPPSATIAPPPSATIAPTKESTLPKGKDNKINNLDAHSAIASELCEYFLSSIIKKEPNTKTPSEKILKSWTCEMEKLLRIDKRDIQEAKALIDYIRSSSSHAYVLSPKSFRQKYDSQREFMKMGAQEQMKRENRELVVHEMQRARKERSDRWKGVSFDKDYVRNLASGKEVSLSMNHEAFRLAFKTLANGGHYG